MIQKQIIFITGNKGKLMEAQSILPQIVGKEIELPEIQEIDAEKIIEAKLREAYKHHQGEYIVEDTSLYIEALNGLPGPLIKWFLQTLGDEGLANLVLKYDNRKAVAKTIAGHINEQGETNYFSGEIAGEIVSPAGDGGFGWDKIFKPENFDKTFGQMTREEKNKISMRKIALEKLAAHIVK